MRRRFRGDDDDSRNERTVQEEEMISCRPSRMHVQHAAKDAPAENNDFESWPRVGVGADFNFCWCHQMVSNIWRLAAAVCGMITCDLDPAVEERGRTTT